MDDDADDVHIGSALTYIHARVTDTPPMHARRQASW